MSTHQHDEHPTHDELLAWAAVSTSGPARLDAHRRRQIRDHVTQCADCFEEAFRLSVSSRIGCQHEEDSRRPPKEPDLAGSSERVWAKLEHPVGLLADAFWIQNAVRSILATLKDTPTGSQELEARLRQLTDAEVAPIPGDAHDAVGAMSVVLAGAPARIRLISGLAGYTLDIELHRADVELWLERPGQCPCTGQRVQVEVSRRALAALDPESWQLGLRERSEGGQCGPEIASVATRTSVLRSLVTARRMREWAGAQTLHPLRLSAATSQSKRGLPLLRAVARIAESGAGRCEVWFAQLGGGVYVRVPEDELVDEEGIELVLPGPDAVSLPLNRVVEPLVLFRVRGLVAGGRWFSAGELSLDSRRVFTDTGCRIAGPTETAELVLSEVEEGPSDVNAAWLDVLASAENAQWFNFADAVVALADDPPEGVVRLLVFYYLKHFLESDATAEQSAQWLQTPGIAARLVSLTWLDTELRETVAGVCP